MRQPATDFVQSLIGENERAFRLLSIDTVAHAVEPGTAQGSSLVETTSQRDALSELLWSGRQAAPVVGADGSSLGKVTLEALARRAAGP